MNKTFLLPLIFIFFSLYYFIFPRESGTEMVWTAAYCESLKTLKSASVPVSGTVVINQGEHRGVINPALNNNYLAEPGFIGSLSTSHAFYKKNETLYLKKFGSSPIAITESEGSPLVLGERYFSVNYGFSLIEEFDDNGKKLWSWKGLAPLTALTWNDDFIATGSLDGRVRLISSTGDILEYPLYPAESDHVVYGVALSNDSRRISIISGLDKQYLSTYAADESQKLLSRIKLDSHYRRPVKMYYSDNGGSLWLEQEDGLLQMTDGEKPLLIPVENTFLTMKQDNEGHMIYVLSRTQNLKGDRVYNLMAYSREGNLLFKSRSSYLPLSFQLSDSQLVFSMNNDLIIMNRQEM